MGPELHNDFGEKGIPKKTRDKDIIKRVSTRGRRRAIKNYSEFCGATTFIHNPMG